MLWIILSQFALLISNFMLLKLLSSELSVHEYGQYALVLSIVLFIRQILYDPFSIVVAKESAKEPEKSIESLHIAKIITDRVSVGLLLCGFIVVLVVEIVGYPAYLSALLMCGILYVCANGAQGVFVNIFNSIKQRKFASVISIIDSVGKILMVTLTFWFVERKLIDALFSIMIAAVVPMMILRFYVNGKIAHVANSFTGLDKKISETISISMPFILPTVLLSVKTIGDRWMLASYLGVSDLAGYSVLLQIGYSPIILLFGMIQTYVAPKIYSLGSAEDSERLGELKSFIKRILLFIMAVTAMACIVVILISDFIFSTLTAAAYHALVDYLQYFVVAGALSAASGILQIAVIGVLKSKQASSLLLMTLLASTASTAIFIYGLGFVGAVMGLVVSGIVTLVLYWVKLNQVLNLKIQEINR